MADDTLRMTSSIEIGAPIQRVWQVLTDVHGYRNWHPLIESADGHLTAGAVVTVRLRTGTDVSVSLSVVDVDSPHHFVYEGGDPVGVTGWHSWTLTATQSGQTRAESEDRFSGAMVSAMTPDQRLAVGNRLSIVGAALRVAAERAP